MFTTEFLPPCRTPRAVARWLATKKTSPLTGAPLKTAVLVPNIALRKLIEEHRAKHHPS